MKGLEEMGKGICGEKGGRRKRDEKGGEGERREEKEGEGGRRGKKGGRPS